MDKPLKNSTDCLALQILDELDDKGFIFIRYTNKPETPGLMSRTVERVGNIVDEPVYDGRQVWSFHGKIIQEDCTLVFNHQTWYFKDGQPSRVESADGYVWVSEPHKC